MGNYTQARSGQTVPQSGQILFQHGHRRFNAIADPSVQSNATGIDGSMGKQGMIEATELEADHQHHSGIEWLADIGQSFGLVERYQPATGAFDQQKIGPPQ